MNSSNLGQFTKYSINTLLTQFVILVISVVASIITARVLGPELRGQLALLLLIPWLAMTLGRMGIGHAVNYFAGKTAPTKLVLNSFILSSFLSIVLVAISLPIVYALKDVFFKTISESLIILISFLIPFYVFDNHLISLLQGFYKINLRNLLLISQSVVNLVLLIILTIIFKLGLKGALAASIIALVFAVFLSALFLFRDINLKEVSLDFSLMKLLLNFGFKSHIGNILKDLSYRGDILIISYFLPASAVGYYIIAVTIAEIIWKIPDSVGSVLLPRIATMEKENARIFTPQVCRRILMPVIFICLIIFVLSKKIVILAFGIQYQPSATALMLLIPGILSFTIWKILANDIIAQGFPTQYSWSSALALLTMIIMDIILIPIFGINGAAVASTISYTTATIFIISIYLKITKNTLRSVLIPSKSDFIFYKSILTNLTNFRPTLNTINK